MLYQHRMHKDGAQAMKDAESRKNAESRVVMAFMPPVRIVRYEFASNARRIQRFLDDGMCARRGDSVLYQ